MLYKFTHEGRLTTTKPTFVVLRAKWRNNTASIRCPQQRKLHQRSLKTISTRCFNFKSIGWVLPKIQASKRSIKIHPTIWIFHSFRNPDPNIFIQDLFTTSTWEPLPTFPKHQWEEPSKTPTPNPRRKFNSNFRTSSRQPWSWLGHVHLINCVNGWSTTSTSPLMTSMRVLTMTQGNLTL